jgi:hypothetical protein
VEAAGDRPVLSFAPPPSDSSGQSPSDHSSSDRDPASAAGRKDEDDSWTNILEASENLIDERQAAR